MSVLHIVAQSETEIELGSLLRQDFQGLHNELLLRLGEHYQQVSAQTHRCTQVFQVSSSSSSLMLVLFNIYVQVFNGLAILASFASNDDPYQGPRDITIPERMVQRVIWHEVKL